MPLALAIVVAVAVVVSAPFVGELRAWMRTQFPGNFVRIVAVVGGALLVVALAAAALRIRDRRLSRYGRIALALAIATGYSLFNAGTNVESNAVERFHFLEYGLITFLFYRAWRPLGDLSTLALPVLAGLIVGAAEEWLQWFIPNRVGELRDIFLNLVAIGCGLLFSTAVLPPDPFVARLPRASRPRVYRMAAATVLVLAAFIHTVHLGYEVRDPEVGTFTSRYDRDTLLALQAAKAEEWRTNPPPLVIRRVSREDQYFSEGIEHVMERNERWAAGEFAVAWRENLILEKYFVPVLDTPTYAGKAGHRWPPEQRTDAEARAAAAAPATAFVSTAYPNRLFFWNRTLFWGLTGVVCAGLVAAASSRAIRRS